MAMRKLNRSAFRAMALASFALFLLTGSPGRAQEIRRIAEPSQPVRMARGGYVCEGLLSVAPIDNTYDTVTCSGPLYNSADYVALYAKLNHDELVKLNATTQEALNSDLRAAIEKRFADLPVHLRQMAAVQNLKRSLMDYVDQRVPAPHPGNLLPRPHTAPSANAQPGAGSPAPNGRR